MTIAMNGLKVNEAPDDSKEEEGDSVKKALRYGLIVLGIPETKYGDDLSKAVLINFIRATYPYVRLDEIRLAFDFAAAKTTIVNTTLYQGEYVSAKFVSEIISSYVALKKQEKVLKIGTTPPIPMINNDRAAKVFEILSQKPEILETLKEIGSVKKSRPDLPPLPFHEIHQEWIRRFDVLRLKFEVTIDGRHTGLIRRYRNWKLAKMKDKLNSDKKQYAKRDTPEIELFGGIDRTDFFAKKAEQLQMAEERKKRNSDVL